MVLSGKDVVATLNSFQRDKTYLKILYGRDWLMYAEESKLI